MPLCELFDASVNYLIHLPTPYLCKLCGASSCRLFHDSSASNFTSQVKKLSVVLGRRASTSVVVHAPPQALQAAEPREFALGPWPPRLDLGHPPSLTPTQLLLGLEAQKFALGPWPLRLDQGLRSSPKPRTGIKWARAGTQGGSSLPLRVSGSGPGLSSLVVVTNKCPPNYTLCPRKRPQPLRDILMPLREFFDASVNYLIHLATPYLCKLCGASSCRLFHDSSASNFTS